MLINFLLSKNIPYSLIRNILKMNVKEGEIFIINVLFNSKIKGRILKSHIKLESPDSQIGHQNKLMVSLHVI